MAKNTIEFKGIFDGSEILKSLKQIRQAMEQAGAKPALFNNVDKEISSTEKLVSNMIAQIQKGFSNPKDIANFSKQLDKLGLSFNKINFDLQDINKAENFSLNSAEIQKYQKELDKLINKQQALEQVSANSVAKQLEKIKISQKEKQAIIDEAKAEGNLEEAIKKVTQAKERAAKSKQGTKALATTEGQAFINSADSNLTLNDMGVTAKSGTSKKGKNDARKRTASGRLTGSQNAREVDEIKAQAAALESYKKALELTVRTGGTARDAIEAMRKSMDEYGLEIAETSKLMDSFDNDLSKFQNNILSPQQRGAISRSQALGSTDNRGNFILNTAGQDIVNNPDVQAARQNLRDIEQEQQNINNALSEGERRTQDFIQEQTNGLDRASQAQNRLEDATEETIEDMREQAEVSQQVNDSFDNMKGAIKTFLSLGAVLTGVRQAINNTFNDIQQLDTAFASIAMVTRYSVQEMWESYDNYAKMANELGQSTKDVIASSALFYQQGMRTV